MADILTGDIEELADETFGDYLLKHEWLQWRRVVMAMAEADAARLQASFLADKAPMNEKLRESLVKACVQLNDLAVRREICCHRVGQVLDKHREVLDLLKKNLQPEKT